MPLYLPYFCLKGVCFYGIYSDRSCDVEELLTNAELIAVHHSNNIFATLAHFLKEI